MDKEWTRNILLEAVRKHLTPTGETLFDRLSEAGLDEAIEAILAAHEADKADALAAQDATWKDIEAELLARLAVMAEALKLAQQYMYLDGLYHERRLGLRTGCRYVSGKERDNVRCKTVDAIEQALVSAPQVLFSGPVLWEAHGHEGKEAVVWFPFDYELHFGATPSMDPIEGEELADAIILVRPEQAGEEE